MQSRERKTRRWPVLAGVTATIALALVGITSQTSMAPARAATANTAATAAAPSHRASGIDIDYSDPILTEIHGPFIKVGFTINVIHTPRTYTAKIELFKWPVIGKNPQLYKGCGPEHTGNCIWTLAKSDLPAAGHAKPWRRDEIGCHIGRFYYKLTDAGVASNGGNIQHHTFFYPRGTNKDGEKDFTVRPKKKESRRIDC